MISLVTSMQDALTHLPRAEEVEEVTTMLGQLQVKEEDLAPHKGNWAYHKSLPSPDNLPSPMHSTIEDVLLGGGGRGERRGSTAIRNLLKTR